MWQAGRWAEFCAMLLMYNNEKCFGEGGMHDTAMLLGALGRDRYGAGMEIITPYFGSSGAGQINAVLPGDGGGGVAVHSTIGQHPLLPQPSMVRARAPDVQRKGPVASARFLAAQLHEWWSRSAAVRVGRHATHS